MGYSYSYKSPNVTTTESKKVIPIKIFLEPVVRVYKTKIIRKVCILSFTLRLESDFWRDAYSIPLLQIVDSELLQSLEDSSRSWLIRSQDGRILRVSLAEMYDNTISSNLHTGDTQPGPDKVKLLHTSIIYTYYNLYFLTLFIEDM